MSKKVAVVTGSNKGLGYSIVKALCSQFDGTVYLTSRDEKRGNDAYEELRKSGLKPVFHQLDVTDESSVKNFYDYIKNQHGSIDILINNAAVLFLPDAPEPKLYQAEQTIGVNFFALVNFNETMLPLINVNGGKIINMSSSSGHLSRIPSEDLRKKISDVNLSLEGLKSLMNSYVEDVRLGKDIERGWGTSSYIVSKNGVNAYTFMLHRRLTGKDITVLCMHPGYVMTDMTHGSGSVSPDEAAGLAVRLALGPCEGGRYYWHTGDIVPWDGPDPRGFLDGMEGV